MVMEVDTEQFEEGLGAVCVAGKRVAVKGRGHGNFLS